MQRKVLKNKPLVEAIFEMRWELEEQISGFPVDSHYAILVGALYERLKSSYPYHEPLPTSVLPSEVSAYVIQHRFRVAEQQWPLVQIGPGIVTLNDTERYAWEDFEKRIQFLASAVFDTFSSLNRVPRLTALLLRYIDAIEFDYQQENLFEFLRDHMKIRIEIDERLFHVADVSPRPSWFDWKFAFPTHTPEGSLQIRFTRGTTQKGDALFWETQVQSLDVSASSLEDVSQWAQQAHELTDRWFFQMIEGELLRRFE